MADEFKFDLQRFAGLRKYISLITLVISIITL